MVAVVAAAAGCAGNNVAGNVISYIYISIYVKVLYISVCRWPSCSSFGGRSGGDLWPRCRGFRLARRILT